MIVPAELIQPKKEFTDRQNLYTISGSIVDLIMQSNVPRRFHNPTRLGISPDGGPLIVSEALSRLCEAWNAGARLIALCGPPGTGKSLACALFLLRREISWNNEETIAGGQWITSARYCNLAPWSEQADQYRTACQLVVDDVGMEEDRCATRIEELVSAFYDDQSTLIFATNLVFSQFQTRYGARAAQRFKEDGSFQTVGEILRPSSRTARPVASVSPLAVPDAESPAENVKPLTEATGSPEGAAENARKARALLSGLTQCVSSPKEDR